MPGHIWRRLYKPSSKNDVYRCFPSLMFAKHFFPRTYVECGWSVVSLSWSSGNYSEASLETGRKIPHENIQVHFDSMPRRLQCMQASHHTEVSRPQIIYSSVIIIITGTVCHLPYLWYRSHFSHMYSSLCCAFHNSSVYTRVKIIMLIAPSCVQSFIFLYYFRLSQTSHLQSSNYVLVIWTLFRLSKYV